MTSQVANTAVLHRLQTGGRRARCEPALHVRVVRLQGDRAGVGEETQASQVADVTEGVDIVPARAVSVDGCEPADPIPDLPTRNEAVFPSHEAAHYEDEVKPDCPGRGFQRLGDERPENEVQVPEIGEGIYIYRCERASTLRTLIIYRTYLYSSAFQLP